MVDSYYKVLIRKNENINIIIAIYYRIWPPITIGLVPKYLFLYLSAPWTSQEESTLSSAL